MIRFSCPACGKHYSVDDRLAGRSTVCKVCKSPLTIPTPAEEHDIPPLEIEEAPAGDFRCPSCGKAMAPNAVLCVSCGCDRRTGAKVRTVVAPVVSTGGEAAPAWRGLLRNPILYAAPALLVVLPVILWIAAVPIGLAIMIPGAILALVCMVRFRWMVRRAVREEHGRAALYAGLLPFVGILFRLFYAFKFWNRAPVAFAGLLLGIAWCVMGAALVTHGFSRRLDVSIHQMASPDVPAAPSVPVAPPLPTPTILERNVQLYDIHLSGTGPGSREHIEFYLPAGADQQQHTLPCVFIAPAGSPMIAGMVLSTGDRLEHLPYVERGFAVAAYDLDGPLPTGGSNRDVVNAVRQFRDAQYGVLNGRIAIDYVLAHVPAIDPDALFAAGHSSAGSVALNLAASEPRIHGVLAYAPGVDAAGRLKKAKSTLAGYVEIDQILAGASPINHVADIRCPVFLFHADDDTTIPTSEFQQLVDALQTAGKKVTVDSVPDGGHYASMIDEGINHGIKFLLPLAPKTPKPGSRKPDSGTASSGAAASRPSSSGTPAGPH